MMWVVAPASSCFLRALLGLVMVGAAVAPPLGCKCCLMRCSSFWVLSGSVVADRRPGFRFRKWHFDSEGVACVFIVAGRYVGLSSVICLYLTNSFFVFSCSFVFVSTSFQPWIVLSGFEACLRAW